MLGLLYVVRHINLFVLVFDVVLLIVLMTVVGLLGVPVIMVSVSIIIVMPAVLMHDTLWRVMLSLSVVRMRVVRVSDGMGMADLPVIRVVHMLQVVVVHQHITVLVRIVLIVVVNILLLVVGQQVFVLVFVLFAKKMRIDKGVMHGRNLNVVSDLFVVMVLLFSVQRLALEVSAHSIQMVVTLNLSLSEVVLMIRLHL